MNKRLFTLCIIVPLFLCISCTKIQKDGNINQEQKILESEVGLLSKATLNSKLTTDSIISIASDNAVVAGTNYNVVEKQTVLGICWSTSNVNPNIDDSTITVLPVLGKFIVSIKTLPPFTTIYVRTYSASNKTSPGHNADLRYGNVLSFRTLKIPSESVTICAQTWMTKNLNVDRYRNGDPIAYVSDAQVWDTVKSGAYCYYKNDSATYASIYNKLYNWYAVVNDIRGLSPQGWHIPSDAEWNTLVKCLDPAADINCSFCQQSLIAFSAMKETGSAHWLTDNEDATNSSGFTALPAGVYAGAAIFIFGGTEGWWWTSTEVDATTAWYRKGVNYSNRKYIAKTNATKTSVYQLDALKIRWINNRSHAYIFCLPHV